MRLLGIQDGRTGRSRIVIAEPPQFKTGSPDAYRWPSDRICAAEPWPFLALNHLGLVTAEKRRRAKAVEAFWKR